MSEQSQLGPSDNATVMLDIGGDIGALIITTTESMLLAEIEVSHADADPHAHRPHVAVRERRGPAGTQYAAIYPRLPWGSTPCGDWTANQLTRCRSWAVK